MRIPANDLQAITKHLQAKGWALAANVLNEQEVAALRATVRVRCATDGPGSTRLDGNVIEHAPAVLNLLKNRHFMAVMRACVGVDEVIVHRSAAILRLPGSPQVG